MRARKPEPGCPEIGYIEPGHPPAGYLAEQQPSPWGSRLVHWAATAAVLAAVVCAVGWPRPTLYALDGLVAAVFLLVGIRKCLTERREPTVDDLTAQEARDLADDLGLQLYRARDALAFVEECCDIADRERRQPTTADVREWIKGAQCARQAGLVIDSDVLRNRVAAAIWERQNPGRQYADCEHPWMADAEADADTVLAELRPELDALTTARADGMRAAAALLRRTPRDSRDYPAVLTGARVIEAALGQPPSTEGA